MKKDQKDSAPLMYNQTESKEILDTAPKNVKEEITLTMTEGQ